MAGGGQSNEIGILVYPGAQLGAVHGLTDLLVMAGRFSAEGTGPAAAPLRVSHWRPDARGVGCIFSSEPATRPQPEILILPPTLSDLPDPQICAVIAHWLRVEHERGAALVSICSGVFLVAATGLLDGRVVSTHRSCAQALMSDFPLILVDADERIIEHPGILTAGGFMAWIDVALMLIERLLGGEIRARTAQFALSTSDAGRAPLRSEFVPRQAHGDAAILRAQQLVHLKDGCDLLLSTMAAAAGLERRTFLRRFMAATGTTPIEYCRAVRIARARELLEASSMPLKTIAESLGYTDVASFAKAFRRVHGLPPGAWRRHRGGAVAMAAAYGPNTADA